MWIYIIPEIPRMKSNLSGAVQQIRGTCGGRKTPTMCAAPRCSVLRPTVAEDAAAAIAAVDCVVRRNQISRTMEQVSEIEMRRLVTLFFPSNCVSQYV